jgi:competence protein ComEC
MRVLGGEGGGRVLRSIRGVAAVGVCSTIATLPLVAHTFGTVSLVGIFLNPFVIVTGEIMVLMGFIWVTLPLEFLEPLFRSVVGGAARLQNRMVEVAAEQSWAAIDVELPGWMVAVGYLLLAVGLVVAMCRKEKRECKIKI